MVTGTFKSDFETVDEKVSSGGAVWIRPGGVRRVKAVVST